MLLFEEKKVSMAAISNKKRVVVTGLGALSVAGQTVFELERTLYQPQFLFTTPSRFTLDFDIIAGEIQESWISDPILSDLETVGGRMSLRAATESIEDALQSGGSPPQALILGTSAGGQVHNEQFVFAHHAQQELPLFNFHKQGVVAAPARYVAEGLNIEGSVMTISTACTSSANAIALGAMWIEQGRYERVLVGGCDDLCATTLAGFHSLLLTGGQPCRPFGQNRPGMTIGEGAAFLCLECLEKVRSSDRPYYGELLGYGLSADAYHITAPSEGGAGAILAMQKALHKADLEPQDINWVNAHGTGTTLNDQVESHAITTTFEFDVPVSSNKALFGHTLGAAGALEAIVSLIAIRQKRAPENYLVSEPGDDCQVNLVPPGGIDLPAHPVIMSNSFGFGGSNCTLIFGLPKGENI
ncbi:beta-ketoacyl-[acyl-carrier-protein] synthase family protein [candidate division CSSED10-310 bacterium]|uniref:Beta-ketoacyl-[acyl-carrier-protein] synthase family protein n=1 Tax=candidate division CSSED10-310 bacterium TaxID=2855610 RepID=A0ABV6Z466_UNCC1